MVRDQASDWGAILEQHKGHILVMRPIDAIGEITGGLSNANGFLLRIIILSYYQNR